MGKPNNTRETPRIHIISAGRGLGVSWPTFSQHIWGNRGLGGARLSPGAEHSEL